MPKSTELFFHTHGPRGARVKSDSPPPEELALTETTHFLFAGEINSMINLKTLTIPCGASCPVFAIQFEFPSAP